ncbi:hypothetical protein [Streptomyces bacillaris]|uniref:hypothetical protein n=1 Tax=Streptomyces bacillaris TaxID=68179 RepID=UPI0011390B8E|nr:hypothetical protein EQG64_23200 [Streptomyces sp. S6]
MEVKVRKKRAALSLVLGTALASGLLMVTAPAASAASCPSSWEPTISGAKGKWTLRCAGKDVVVSGWIEDTRADGKCARVHSIGGNGSEHQKQACGKGNRASFEWRYYNTDTAHIRLSIK